MQRITEKRIDNSSLVPTRIAEAKTSFRQPKPLGVDLSGLQRGFKALGSLADTINNEFEKADREMDQLAEIKVNSILSAAEIEARGKFEQFSLTELPEQMPLIRENFSASVQSQIADVPMTDRMRKLLTAKMAAVNEDMRVKFNYEYQRKQARYVMDGWGNELKTAMDNGDEATALAVRQKLVEMGAKVPYTESDIKSNAAFVNLRTAFDNNDFEYIEQLKATGKDGKFSKFKDLKYEDRMNLIRDAEGKQKKLQDDNYNKYLVDIAEGKNQYTIDHIREMYEQGGLTERGYVSMLTARREQNYIRMCNEINGALEDIADDKQPTAEMYENFANMVEMEYAAGNITESRRNEFLAAIKEKNVKEKIAAMKLQSEKEKKESEYTVKGLKAQIMSLPMPHANQYQLVRSAWIGEIQKYITDPLQQREMIDFLEKELKDDPLEKSENGRATKAYINEIFSEYAASGEEDNTMVNNWKLDALYIARQMNMKGANFSDIRKKIDEAVKLAAEKDIPRLINSGMRLIDPAKYGKIYTGPKTQRFIAPTPLGLTIAVDQKAEIPEGMINPDNVVKRYKGEDENKNKVIYWDVRQPDGSIETIIANDYEEIK